MIFKKVQIFLRRPLVLEADACDPQDPGPDAADKRPFVLHEIRGDQKAAGLKNTVDLRQYLLRIRDNVQSVGEFTDQFPWQW